MAKLLYIHMLGYVGYIYKYSKNAAAGAVSGACVAVRVLGAQTVLCEGALG